LNLGYYALVTNINEIVLQLPRAAYNVIFPRVSDSQERVTELTASTCRIFFTGIWCWYLIILLAGPWIIRIVGGAQYAGAYNSLVMQFPFVPFMSVAIVLSGFIAGLNRPNLLLQSSFATLIFMVAANFLLTPVYGIYGAAVSKVLSGIFYLGVMFFLLRVVVPWRIIDILVIKKTDLIRMGEIKDKIWARLKASPVS
jgi:O-antigen/teichoic acid export membrane protein